MNHAAVEMLGGMNRIDRMGEGLARVNGGGLRMDKISSPALSPPLGTYASSCTLSPIA